MKKTLLLCGLGLTVATSMVAGTMAIYTHTDTILAKEVTGTAKKFYINAKLSENTTIENFYLAPSESVNWDFEVTNEQTGNEAYVSEVDTDLTVSLNAGTISNWEDLQVFLVKDGNEKPLVSDGNTITITEQNAFKAGTNKNQKYSLRFKWVDTNDAEGNKKDTDLVYGKKTGLPTISGITVTVTGSQHVNN